MQISSNVNNPNFKGKLFVGPNISDNIINAIKASNVVKKILSSPDDLYVATKMRLASRDEVYRQGRDDELFKMYFFVKKPVRKFKDKIKNFFIRRQYLTPSYHSSSTNYHLITDENYLSSILSKWIKNN